MILLPLSVYAVCVVNMFRTTAFVFGAGCSLIGGPDTLPGVFGQAVARGGGSSSGSGSGGGGSSSGGGSSGGDASESPVDLTRP